MKIKELTLTNIGPFVGRHTIDFTTGGGKNIVLIGGKNGAGKTTVLKSIKIGLYGCFAYGYKTENITYMKEIGSILSYFAESGEYSIKLTVELAEKFSESEYVILRSWRKHNESITETLSVAKDGEILSESDSLEFAGKIRAVASPELVNSYIFDGEAVGGFIDSDKTDVYLRSVFNSIFNIDILYQFREDLTAYLNNEKSRANVSSEYGLSSMLTEVNGKKASLSSIKERRKVLRSEINDINIRLAALQNEFIKLGGIPKEQARELRCGVKSLEKATNENYRMLREFYEDYLPYCILAKEIASVADRGRRELPGIYASMLEEVQRYMKVDFSAYIDELKSVSGEPMLGLKEEEITELDRLAEITQSKKASAVSVLSGKNNLVDKMTEMRGALESSFSVARLDEIITETKKLTEEFAAVKNSEARTAETAAELEREIAVMLDKYEKMLDAGKRGKTVEKSYLICASCIKVVDRLTEHIKTDKLKALSAATLAMFNETVRKTDYLSGIEIDGDFDLRLYSKGKRFDMSALSAGETQILVSCIIRAMFKISGRREMFVFDSPLARLDGETRTLFINNIVADIGDQVVILSTDSEFIGKEYMSVSDRIARTYLLDYDDASNSTVVRQSYFGE